jgi:hypothetical protein
VKTFHDVALSFPIICCIAQLSTLSNLEFQYSIFNLELQCYYMGQNTRCVNIYGLMPDLSIATVGSHATLAPPEEQIVMNIRL